MSFEISKIGQISVTVRDLARAIQFYQEALELNLVMQTERMAFFTCGEVRVMLTLPEKAEFEHSSSVVYYDVPNIEEAYEALCSRNISFLDAPHKIGVLGDVEVWMAFFRDSEGNLIAIQSEVPVQEELKA